MSVVGDIFGAGSAFDFAGKVIDKIFPDKDEADKAKLRLLELTQSGKLAELQAETGLLQGQLEINKAQAQSASMFVAGPRPFILWIGATAFGLITVPVYAALTAVWLWQCIDHGELLSLPDYPIEALMVVLLPLLGLRTVETVTGTARARIKAPSE